MFGKIFYTTYGNYLPEIYLTKIPCLLLLIDFIALAKCQIINVYNNVTLGPKIVLMIE